MRNSDRFTRIVADVPRRFVVAVGAVSAAVLFALPCAAADSAQDLFRDARAREETLRVEANPEPGAVKAAIRAYELVVRRYPRSAYSDNALWQAAGLARDLFTRTGDRRELDRAVRLLRLLVSGYPSSSLVPGAVLEVARLVERPAEAVPSAAASAATPAAPARPRGAVTSLTRVVLPEVVRLIVELDSEVPFHHERIEDPTRVFVDLPNTEASASVRQASLAYDDDILRQIRIGRRPPDTTRIVLDLDGLAGYSVFTLYEPFRIVIDCERGPDAIKRAAARSVAHEAPADAVPALPPAPPAPNAAGGFSIGRQLGLGAARIVIDPGHGGRDPGAQHDRLTEADVVLDIALRLEKRLLEQPSIDVVLTRRSDQYLALEDRTALANKEGADLFLSIHANSSRNAKTRGIETYFLNFSTNAETEHVAARENAASGQTMNSLPGLIRSITLNNKRDESKEFATLVQRALVEGLRSEGMQDLGVKQAPFVVLIGAEMPSVLAEVAFLTNPEDQALLGAPAYRQRIADALLAGVLRYQQALKATLTQAAKQ